MLNNQHVIAQSYLSKEEKAVYQSYMCGLCGALGREYGFLSRIVTNHEMILLNMMADSLSEQEQFEKVSCPLNPFKKVNANNSPAAALAAAASVIMAKTSAQDHSLDSGRKDILALLLSKALDRLTSKAYHHLGDPALNQQVIEKMLVVQKDNEEKNLDPEQTTVFFSETLFRLAAVLSSNQAAAEKMGQLGSAYGKYIYWMDAFRDLPDDILQHQYNGLKPYTAEKGKTISFSETGMSWLKQEFEQLDSQISGLLAEIPFLRNQAILQKLMLKPVQTVVEKLGRDISAEKELTFHPWNWRESLKLSAQALPAMVGLAGFTEKTYALAASSHWSDQYMVSMMDSCSDYQAGSPGCIMLVGIGFCLAMCGCCGPACQLQACCFCDDLCKC